MDIELEQKEVIEGNLSEKIIVNAPPGSGKTETIIQKLIYIYNNNLAKLDDVLVICFTRAAVKEISDRVGKVIGIRNRVNVRTIDSFCSMIIRNIEDNYKEQFSKMNYDDRVELVLKLLESNSTLIDDIKRLKHIIVDEFQDIVEIRAKLILKILEIHQNGFSILGDECQAIFNYQAEELTADRFIENIIKDHPDCRIVEYCVQHRENSEKQRDKNNEYRKIIKAHKNNPQKLNEYIQHEILTKIKKKKIEYKPEKKIAILARQNGQVYEIANKLDNNIPYKIQNYSSSIVFPKWIGYLLGDVEQNYLAKEQFETLIKQKLNVDKLDKYWNYCKEIENDIYNEDEINLSKLKENMIIDKGQYPNDFNENDNGKIIISTIHKAKGREYDEVYLHFRNSDFVNNTNVVDLTLDNARTLYVALTRAKENYYKYEYEIKWTIFRSFKDGINDRYYGFVYGKNKYYNSKTKKIENRKIRMIRKIEIGLEGDIDYNSFIDPEIVSDVKENQEYIYNKIKIGDIVDLKNYEGKFYIYHKGKRIGCMNIENVFKNASYDLFKKYYTKKELKAYRNIRVKSIITVAKFPDYIDDKYDLPYRNTGLWNAIELEGFGKLDFIGDAE